MPIFGGSTEPGSDAFLACPDCGKDEIFSQSDGVLSETEYHCDNCGYEAEKEEVRRSFDEMYKQNKAKNDELLNEKMDDILGKKPFPEAADKSLDKISDPELRQEVKDRQTEGWEIEEITGSGNRVVMVTTKGGTIGGHALTGVLTGLWALGMGNVAYDKLSKGKNEERIVLRADSDSSSLVEKQGAKNPIEKIRELKQLNDEGLITDTEFEEKKQKLLDDV